MGSDKESFDPEWGTKMARGTMIFTVLLTVAFAAAVFIFIF